MATLVDIWVHRHPETGTILVSFDNPRDERNEVMVSGFGHHMPIKTVQSLLQTLGQTLQDPQTAAENHYHIRIGE